MLPFLLELSKSCLWLCAQSPIVVMFSYHLPVKFPIDVALQADIDEAMMTLGSVRSSFDPKSYIGYSLPSK